jgi:polyisoprenoid-binding protein YceI
MEDAQNITTSQKITTYRLDPRPGRFIIRVTAGGLLSAFGHNPLIGVRDFSGVQFDPEAAQSASLRMRVPSRSLEVADDVNEDDVNEKDRREIERIMHEQVLESNSYPTIEFQSNEMKVTPSGPGSFARRFPGNFPCVGLPATRRSSRASRPVASACVLPEFSLIRPSMGFSW